MIKKSFLEKIERIKNSYFINNLKFFYSGLKIKKYILQKEPINVSYEVKSAPLINSKSLNVDKNGISNEEYEKIIDDFINIMLSNFLPENFKMMCQNIKNLSFEEKKMFILQGGKYSIGNNCITFNSLLNKRNDNTSDIRRQIIMHELLHMSSAIIYKRYVFSGFYQAAQKNLHYSIGKGLNEGYTELLNQRYFCKNPPLVCYAYQVSVLKLVEMIIGKEKMTNLYFLANLKGVIKALSQYTNESQVKTFIINLDKTIKYQKRKIIAPPLSIVSSTNRQICGFLLSTYANKLLLDVKNGKITKEESNQMITEYYKLTTELYDKIKPNYSFRIPKKDGTFKKIRIK